MERHRRAQRILAWIVQLGAVLQFFLAGLAVFRAKPHGSDKLFESSAFDPHRFVGDAVILFSFALLVVAILNREQIRLASLLFLATALQYALAALGQSVAALGALHPVNGLLVLGLSHVLARGPRAAAEKPARRQPAAEEQPAPAD